MDKKDVKRIINEFIDSVDEIEEFVISRDVEETDRPTLNGTSRVVKPTGKVNLYLTAYKE